MPAGGRLHVACGNVRLDGWINIDKFPTAASDYVVDVRYGLPFRQLSRIFAEHFVEHLAYEEAVSFLKSCRAALAEDGVLRLSTPSLDWVYFTQYHPQTWSQPEEPVRDCFALNKSFRGWDHQFLFNLPALTAVLHDAGFARVDAVRYGESKHPDLRSLERHERSPDLPELPHVLVVEASGTDTPAVSSIAELADDYLRAYRAR